MSKHESSGSSWNPVDNVRKDPENGRPAIWTDASFNARSSNHGKSDDNGSSTTRPGGHPQEDH